jgi:class 3 adenylate cyclase
MPARELHYRWEWDLQASPEELWPLVADTDRFNRDAGVPALEEGAIGPNARRRLALSKLGLRIEWEEEPFEWVRPHRFSVVRRYLRGPLAEMRVAAELTPLASGGTRLVYQVWATPRNTLGRLAAPVEIGTLSARRFESVFREYDARVTDPAAAPDPPAGGARRFAPGGSGRLAAGRDALVEQGAPPELATRLADLVERGDDADLARLRPYALADAWEADRRAVLELCLRATRAGLLELRWDLLCPLCRGAKERAPTLAEIERNVHCDTCNIDFGVEFDRSVELTFRPSPAIRELDEAEYCVAGPQVTPHVIAQQLLPIGAARTLTATLERGRYRLRALDLPGGASVLVGEGAREATVAAADAGWPAGELLLAETSTLRLVNGTDREQLFVLERTAWRDDAATAAEVTALQVFRDLFSTEALRPGEPISVGTLTIVFTDLRDSTRFYREIGDAPAFGSVMEHLDVLYGAVADAGGAVVKSMGDAIMAVFVRPAPAVSGMLAAQHALATPAEGKRPLFLKAGIHSGPCIAITQNDRLDYFGSTVNLAARLVGLSTGSDVVVSGAVLADPEVQELIGELAVEPTEGELKGFDDERVELWRLAVAVPARA